MNVDSSLAGRLYGRRADAQRNREKVLDHSVCLLSEHPAAGMAEIAAAAGIGRATLYRHFRTREDLLRALAARAVDDVVDAIAGSRLQEGSASEALPRLIAAFFTVLDRYRFLLNQRVLHQSRQEETISAINEIDVRGPIEEFFESGRAAGDFTSSLSADWMTAMLVGVVISAVLEIASGRVTPGEAESLTVTTMLRALAPL